jgi:hypothetical protein
VIVFGGIWIFLEPVALIFPRLIDRNWGLFIAVVVISVLACLWRARPRNRLSFDLPPTGISINIEVGDVLDQSGNVVIGSNDVFDTTLEEEIINEASVQGQLLKRIWGGDVEDLDRQISQSLKGVDAALDPEKVFGKRYRYGLGTVPVVKSQNTRYFLPAIATMSALRPPHTSATIAGVQAALTEAWQTVGQAGQREPVHAPIIGSHLARLNLSHTWLVQMMVLSFVAVATKEGGSVALTIWVAERDSAKVDLAALDDWLHALCAV